MLSTKVFYGRKRLRRGEGRIQGLNTEIPPFATQFLCMQIHTVSIYCIHISPQERLVSLSSIRSTRMLAWCHDH